MSEGTKRRQSTRRRVARPGHSATWSHYTELGQELRIAQLELAAQGAIKVEYGGLRVMDLQTLRSRMSFRQ